jgi:hypothetical protein
MLANQFCVFLMVFCNVQCCKWNKFGIPHHELELGPLRVMRVSRINNACKWSTTCAHMANVLQFHIMDPLLLVPWTNRKRVYGTLNKWNVRSNAHPWNSFHYSIRHIFNIVLIELVNNVGIGYNLVNPRCLQWCNPNST